MPPGPVLNSDSVSGRIIDPSNGKSILYDFILGMTLHVRDLPDSGAGERLRDFA